MRLLLWFSGEHPSLPRAEALAAFDAEGFPLALVAERERLLVADVDVPIPRLEAIVQRLGMTHDASAGLFDSEPDVASLETAARDCRLPAHVRFEVRAERLGRRPGKRTTLEREIGKVLAPGRIVDLKNPDVTVRAFADGDRVWVGQRIWDRDPKETTARHVKHRPVGSPVSLPPKLARALLNLAHLPTGSVAYDPFCGTGGILLEAAAMGIRIVGSDLDPAMVDATKRNLAHFRLEALDMFTADIGDAPARLVQRGLPPPDAVVSDLPYGRSASTGKEPLPSLYDRGFDAAAKMLPSGRPAILGLPSDAAARRAGDFLTLEHVFKVWVHRSLTRHFAVLRR